MSNHEHLACELQGRVFIFLPDTLCDKENGVGPNTTPKAKASSIGCEVSKRGKSFEHFDFIAWFFSL